MKRRTKFQLICNALLVFLAACCVTSCFTTLAVLSAAGKANKNNISRESAYLELKIIQTLGKGEALAFTEKYDVVKIESLTEVYYDGKIVKGNFILLDTYTYQNRKGLWKTVPVFVLTKEYRKNKEIWDILHSEKDDNEDDGIGRVKVSII